MNPTWIQYKQAVDQEKKEEELALQEFSEFLASGDMPVSDMDAGIDADEPMEGGETPESDAPVVEDDAPMTKAGRTTPDARVAALGVLDAKSSAEYKKSLSWLRKKLRGAVD
jgi:hypothetical protein